MRILVVEDDTMIGKALSQALRDDGYAVDWVRDGADAANALSNHGYTAALLDLGLPGRDGLEVLRSMRAGADATPVLVVTARDGLEDRIAGLDLGADDYLIKPFEIRELLARLRAVIRRRHGGQATTIVRHGDLSVDLDTHRVDYRGHSHVLGAREFALVQALVERPGALLTRAQLEERLYGWGEEVESNAVDVLIHYVRRKFGKDVIRNVRGSGWMIGGGD
jgi:DNA-binding response OmpR family regulator